MKNKTLSIATLLLTGALLFAVCAVLSVCSVVAVSCPAVVEGVLPVVFPVCPHPAKKIF